MPSGICPNCNQRYSYCEWDTDYVHQCTGSSVLSQEDRPRITDPNYNHLGQPNKLMGKLVNTVDAPKINKLTPRGNTDLTHYQRQYYHYIELGDK